LGDKGSGYEIGLRGLKASVHFLDRHGRWPLLGRNILRALHLNAPEDLIDWAKVAAKSEIAALAVEVFESAREGDKTARDILDGAVASLAKDGVHCAQRLVKPGAPVEFIFAGSVLLKQPAFAKRVKRRLLELWPGARTGNLQREGAYGALALAVGKPSLNKTVETSSIYGPSSLRMSPTEERNPRSRNLDRLPLLNAVALMIQEEAKVSRALLKEKQNIARVVEWVAGALRRGGRLFYVGAGTSGRLGILDAAECPPTFRALPEQVQGIIAGGQSAIWKSIEGAEDNAEAGASAIEWRGVNRRDVVIGIAASGRTPFVWGAFDAARRKGAKTVLICFNPYLEIRPGNRPDLVIAPVVGPEVLTGSTRLKAGTATKVILNTITTLAMTRLGKVAGNLMVDLNASNKKLRDRAVRIVQEVTGADAMTARGALEKSKWIVKTACQRLR
jgi:N-acetylmuramic acid 6-phosphate etherase